MARKTYVWDGKKMVPKPEASYVPSGPSVIGDIGEVVSAINGKTYTSRSTYGAHVKSHGCEIVGNDWNNLPMKREAQDAPDLVGDIKRAMGEG